MSATQAWIRALSLTKGAANETLPGLLDELAETHASHPCLLSSSQHGDGQTHYTLSYCGLARRVRRYARWAQTHGLGFGDVVGLMMPNCIDYVAVWLGLTRTGCTVALLNTHLRGDAVRHCLHVANASCLIITDDTDAGGVPLIRWEVLQAEAQSLSAEPMINTVRPDDRALLIYTSGTTGLPKATNITHRRIIEWSYWFAGMMDAQPTDRLYDCLPLYHSTGGVVAIGAMLVSGGSVYIRERFSTSRFWDDVVDNDCTIFQYIGELCRYLTLSPSHPRERDHGLRLACGNGLQGEVWRQFQERFAIPQILEFYAATEGNLSLYNCEGKPGSIGRVPPFLAKLFAAAIIRCDLETGEPIRDANGLCILCGPDEPGEAISRIGERQFDGYTDPDASAGKILRNVVKPGDQWFRSGDLMRKDTAGYYYFLDRLGDTFRYKGENVATAEVAAVLCNVPGVLDAVVFGVALPEVDGRVGMAALVADTRFSFDALWEHLNRHLPDYAQPIFIRFCTSIDKTGTFKLIKAQLAREGCETTDPVWQREADRYRCRQL